MPEPEWVTQVRWKIDELDKAGTVSTDDKAQMLRELLESMGYRVDARSSLF